MTPPVSVRWMVLHSVIESIMSCFLHFKMYRDPQNHSSYIKHPPTQSPSAQTNAFFLRWTACPACHLISLKFCHMQSVHLYTAPNIVACGDDWTLASILLPSPNMSPSCPFGHSIRVVIGKKSIVVGSVSSIFIGFRLNTRRLHWQCPWWNSKRHHPP